LDSEHAWSILSVGLNSPLWRIINITFKVHFFAHVIEFWRREYNRYRPHSSLGYKPSAPEAYEVKNLTQQVAL